MRSAVIFLALASLVEAQNPPGFLKIQVIEGEGAFNSIRSRGGHSPIVEVRDEQDRVVAGAKVKFLLPATGPGGTFANGAQSAEIMTDDTGRASAPALTPNRIEGRFNIKITATTAEREGSIVIAQTNTLAGGEATSHRSKKAILLVILAGAAGGGAIAALHGGGKSPAPAAAAAPAPVVLTVGSVTVGAPH